MAFCLGTVTFSAAMNILVHVFLVNLAHISAGDVPRSGIAGVPVFSQGPYVSLS